MSVPESITREDLRRTRSLAVGMLALVQNTPETELTNLGISPEDVAELKESLAATDRLLPSAKNTVLASFAGYLTKEMVLTGYARAQQALHALAPLVVLRMAAKIDDDQAPGSTRLLLEMAKGLGLLIPAESVSAPKRLELLDLDGERRKPIDVLKDEVLRYSS